jgi:DNA-binding IclR family transcriptional regulator
MLQLIGGFWVSHAIYIAAKLGIADLLTDQPQRSEELAQATGTHALSLHRVLRALASVGVFAEDDQGRFALTPLGATLQTGVPGSLRAWATLTLGDMISRRSARWWT